MGFVFQNYNLLANFTAHENVEAPMMLAQVGCKERKERTRALLERVVLADRAYHQPGELSGGQQRATLRSSVNITPRSWPGTRTFENNQARQLNRQPRGHMTLM